jgi:transposase
VARKRPDERIAELERENARLRAENAELRAENAELRAEVQQLNRRYNELLAEFRRLTGRNDPRQKGKSKKGKGAAKPERKPSKRKRGGQPGHPKHERPLLPPDQVDEVHDCIPERCEEGEARLKWQRRQPAPAPGDLGPQGEGPG